MLNDATGLKKIYLAAGYTDLRRGMDGLATIIRFRFQLDPYDKNTLFLFASLLSITNSFIDSTSLLLLIKFPLQALTTSSIDK